MLGKETSKQWPGKQICICNMEIAAKQICSRAEKFLIMFSFTVRTYVKA